LRRAAGLKSDEKRWKAAKSIFCLHIFIFLIIFVHCMFNRILLTAYTCLYFFTTFAQPKVPEHVFYQKLDNGLEVLVLEDHK
jgi:hypothetical protein